MVEYALAAESRGPGIRHPLVPAEGGILSAMRAVDYLSSCDPLVPIVSYAAAYPVALILMTVFARLPASVLS